MSTLRTRKARRGWSRVWVLGWLDVHINALVAQELSTINADEHTPVFQSADEALGRSQLSKKNTLFLRSWWESDHYVGDFWSKMNRR